jgi:N-acetylmuramoyl-L-alanine amidase
MGYCAGIEVREADVNVRTREMFTQHLESVGATVYLVPRPPPREQRVLAAESAGAEVLVSIHHNGYTDDAENYATTFVTDDLDWSLALEVHPRLIAALTQSDSGIQYEDFGITHHGDLPAILTEATFITSSDEACNFLGNQSRIRAEALALFHGIVAYFVATLSELAATGTRLVGGRCPPH